MILRVIEETMQWLFLLGLAYWIICHVEWHDDKCPLEVQEHNTPTGPRGRAGC